MNITPLLIDTLKFIQKYTMENTYPPALSDIMQHFKISKTPARNRVLRLEKLGLIKREPRKARTIKLMPEGIEAIAIDLLPPRYTGYNAQEIWLKALDDARHGNFTLEDDND